MKVIEIINFNRELLKKLQEAGVRLEDVQYVELYSEYMYRTSQGEKVSYVVAVLSEKYSVSERTIYALVKRFRSDCKTFASMNGLFYQADCAVSPIFRMFHFYKEEWL